MAAFRLPTLAVLLLALAVPPPRAEAGPGELPRFTEEREAAALFFLKKHVPEVLPLLEQLRKSDPPRYRQEIREVFRVTEMLADLEDDPRRHDLELRIWKAENKALALAARLSAATEEERHKAEVGLRELARELVELDIQVLELKAEQLDKEAAEIKEELARMRDGLDRRVKERYEALLEPAKRPRK